MTDKEIIKALECCGKTSSCDGCPLKEDMRHCTPIVSINALNLINRQKAEIDRLNKENDRLSQCVLYHEGQMVDNIKDFAEMVKPIVEQIVEIMFDDNESKCQIEGCKKPFTFSCGSRICIDENKDYWCKKIDNIAKEVAGENNE